MTTFDREYWARQQEVLNVDDDIRHVDFAQFVADHCRDKLRVAESGNWYRWTGTVWQETQDDKAARQTVTLAAAVLLEHGMNEDPSDYGWCVEAASKMHIAPVRSHIVKEMSALPDFQVSVDDLDAQRHLMAFQNGTVDLRTGELMESNPDHLLTRCAECDYDPDAEAPRWERFIKEIFPDDPELQKYYQVFLGMCITGEVREHALGVWYGKNGRNGKGTTVRAMEAAFGKEMIQEVDFSLYEGGRTKEPHTEELAKLRGARMVIAQESESHTQMNTARLKKHSGGDRIQARHLYGRAFSFVPTFTLVLATNHLPEFSGGGAALWARTKALHFTQHFVGDKVDPYLESTIQGPEREGVAAWCVRGAVEYYKQGRLIDPPSVLAAKEMHMDETDPLKPLVGELFDYTDDEDVWVKRSMFNADLKKWREDNGEKGARFSPSVVKRELLSRAGVQEKRKSGVGWVYTGVYLLSNPPSSMKPAAGPGIFGKDT